MPNYDYITLNYHNSVRIFFDLKCLLRSQTYLDSDSKLIKFIVINNAKMSLYNTKLY